GEAWIQANGILGNPFQPPEYVYAADGVTIVQDNWVVLSTKMAAHEMAHLLGVRHQDAFGPIGFGIHTPPGAGAYTPPYPGPSGAFETFNHIISSPASVGSDRFNDVNSTLFFGEREAVKIAFALSGTTVNEVSGDANSHAATNATAQALTLAPLTVPNTLKAGSLYYGLQFAVKAVAVTGTLQTAAGATESDIYSFIGKKGDLINLDVMAGSQARYAGDNLNLTVSIYDSTGTLVGYYTLTDTATNDDQFE